MGMKRFRLITLLVAIPLIVCSVLFLIRYRALKEFEKELLTMAQKKNVDIQFYGIVVDQNGKPVADAVVEMDRMYFMLGNEAHKVVSNAEGIFSITGIKGRSLRLRSIAKKGYEYIRRNQNLTNYDYSSEIEKNRYISNPSKPEIFTLRKMNDAVFLLEDEFLKKIRKDEFYLLDIVRSRIKKEVDSQYYPDLKISNIQVGLISQTIVEAIGDGAGIILASSPIYRAPDSGYKREITIPINVRSRKGICLVVRTSRDLYALLNIQITLHDDGVMCHVKSYVNPYGGRSLEKDPYLPAETYVKLRVEAKKSLRRGKIPNMPERYMRQ